METEAVAADAAGGGERQRSLLAWMFDALGLPYALLLAVTGLGCLVLTLVVVVRGRGPMAGVTLWLLVHMPFMIGFFAGLQGAIRTYQVIATSGSAPRPVELAEGISTALIAPLVGLLLTAPSYLVATLGGLIRSLTAKSSGGSSQPDT